MSVTTAKEMELCVGSYNITATYFCDPKNETDPKSGMHHTWEKRRKYFCEALTEAKCDVMALQELSPEQALDFLVMFPKHKFFFFVQAQTEEVKAGHILQSIEEVKNDLLGKFIGTPLTGIMYNPEIFEPKKSGIFWYNPNPFQRPTATDRAQTDKGFGNMNTPRGPGYVQFTHKLNGKEFYFFTSHAPISGGSQTRSECFKLENETIPQITNGVPFFSVGDRNLIPDDNGVDDKAYDTLVSPKNGIYDWVNQESHDGFKTTWLGYLYEPCQFQNEILANGTFKQNKIFDVGTSSLKSFWSAHYHCIIRDDKVELLGALNEGDNQTRNFLSDHSMLVAKFHF